MQEVVEKKKKKEDSRAHLCLKCGSVIEISKLKEKEKKEGFSEAPKSKLGDSKIPFFNLGPKNNWKIILNDDLKEKLNKVFKKQLEELSY